MSQTLMEPLLKVLCVFMPLPLAYLFWLKWVRERRSGVIHVKLNSPVVAARRDKNPLAFRLFSALTFMMALIWALMSPFLAIMLWR
jgi:hypothetical protein